MRSLASLAYVSKVFDVIYLNGHSVALDLLSKRLTHVAEAVKMYRDGVEAQRIPKEHPFELIGKAFFPKVVKSSIIVELTDAQAHIRHLLGKISNTTPHERTYASPIYICTQFLKCI